MGKGQNNTYKGNHQTDTFHFLSSPSQNNVPLIMQWIGSPLLSEPRSRPFIYWHVSVIRSLYFSHGQLTDSIRMNKAWGWKHEKNQSPLKNNFLTQSVSSIQSLLFDNTIQQPLLNTTNTLNP